MKKWLIAVLLTAVTAGVVIAGNGYHQSQLDTTAREAMHIAMTDESGRSLGNLSTNRFDDLEEGGSNGEDGDGSTESSGIGTSSNGGSSSINGNITGSSAEDVETGEAAGGLTSSGDDSTAGSSSSSGGSDSVSTSGLSEEDIVDTYFRQFEQLQRQEQKRVNELIQDAQDDLSAYRAGESEKSRSELQVSYVNRVGVLEEKADSRFNEIYRELTTALEENGYDVGVAEEFRIVYESEKESRRLEAINRLFQ